MEFPSFKEVINRNPKSIAAGVTIAEFDDAMSGLKALLVSWMEEQEILALRMIQFQVTDDFSGLGIQIPTEPFDLMLATNMFCCKGCQDAIDFRRMARHQHAYKSPREGLLPLQRSPWDLLCDVPHGGFPDVYYSPHISKMAAWVVSMCNLDPATTTIDEMDPLDPWFESNVCQRDSEGMFAARNWRLMINHQHDCFRLLDNDEMAQVRSSLEYNSDVDMWCTYCDNVIPFHGKGDHLRRKHQLDRPVEPDDYIRPTIYNPIPSIRIMVYPSKDSAK